MSMFFKKSRKKVEFASYCKIGIDEDLEGYTFLIAYSMRQIIIETLDTRDKEFLAGERAKIKTILDLHRPRLEKYLEPYRNLRTDEAPYPEHHRVCAATAVFDWPKQ